MTLFQALAKSEECNCGIIHREAGIKLTRGAMDALDGGLNFNSLMVLNDSWQLDDSPATLVFEAEFMGISPINGATEELTAFMFKGNHNTIMPKSIKVRVTLEPIE